jgi:hypothetical protein
MKRIFAGRIIGVGAILVQAVWAARITVSTDVRIGRPDGLANPLGKWLP